MSWTEIDVRGLACPEPVIRVRRVIQEGSAGTIAALVNDEVSAENIERMAGTLGWAVSREVHGDDIHLTLVRGDDVRIADRPAASPQTGTAPIGAIVFVTSDVFGEGDRTLGAVLMRAFVKTLKDLDPVPGRAFFVNSGVRLTTLGSELIDDLRALEAGGMRILSCGTCLDYYHLKDSLQVGQATNMYEIASALLESDRVLRP
jgi:selenium metabolism protein YedF